MKKLTWSKLKASERRIRIAKDVLSRLKAGGFNVMDGNAYVASHRDPAELVYPWLPSHDELQHSDPVVDQKATKGLRETCNVCALGAMFLARIERFNRIRWSQLAEEQTISADDPRLPAEVTMGISSFDYVTISGVNADRENIVEAFHGTFSDRQLNLIETAFEKRYCFADPAYDDDQASAPELYAAAIQFGEDHRNSRDRLQAIMQNIVDHKGTFKPAVRYTVTKV